MPCHASTGGGSRGTGTGSGSGRGRRRKMVWRELEEEEDDDDEVRWCSDLNGFMESRWWKNKTPNKKTENPETAENVEDRKYREPDLVRRVLWTKIPSLSYVFYPVEPSFCRLTSQKLVSTGILLYGKIASLPTYVSWRRMFAGFELPRKNRSYPVWLQH